MTDNASATLASFTYDILGRRTQLARGSGRAVTNYGYDGADRLMSLEHTLSDEPVTFGLSYSPASQIIQRTISNDDYSWVPTSPVSQAFTYEGRNQDAALASASGYDANANEITSQDAARSFTYDLENRLLTASGGSASLGTWGRVPLSVR